MKILILGCLLILITLHQARSAEHLSEFADCIRENEIAGYTIDESVQTCKRVETMEENNFKTETLKNSSFTETIKTLNEV